MMGPMTTSCKSVIVRLCGVFLILAGKSDSGIQTVWFDHNENTKQYLS